MNKQASQKPSNLRTAIPDAVLQKHLGILGINGSGKTYTAKGAVEGLLDRGARVCIIDPTGVWWGIKSNNTGKRGAYPVVVFGGEHRDVDITGTHGETIAEAIGTSSTSAIIDTSLMRVGERTRFFADFAETLRVKNQGPLHLFIDEAHLFAPQGRVSDPQSANMLHAANNLISLGRARGLRVTLISQRPAKIHKDSLSQIHSLIAMRMVAPQDRAAVEGWIADQADTARGKEIIASLPSLKTGEGYLWSPELDILERVTFPVIRTFDSSRTPDDENGAASVVLAPIDLAAIQGKLEVVKQSTASNDPVKLKQRIRELESQMAQRPKDVDPQLLEQAVRDARAAGEAAGRHRTLSEAMTAVQSALAGIGTVPTGQPPARKASLPAPAVPMVAARPATPRPDGAQVDGLNGPQAKILRSLQFWRSIGNDAPTKAQVAAVAGYSPLGGAFGNPIGQLRSKGLVDYPQAGRVTLVGTGTERAMSLTEARDTMLSVLDGPQRKIIGAFQGIDGAASRADVADRSGYLPKGGAFGNPVGSLCTLGILDKPSPGYLSLTAWARELLQ